MIPFFLVTKNFFSLPIPRALFQLFAVVFPHLFQSASKPVMIKSMATRIPRTNSMLENLEHAIFDERHADFHSAIVKAVEEARQLIDTGFEYVCTYNDVMLFRKRK